MWNSNSIVVTRVQEIKNDKGNYAFIDLVDKDRLGETITGIARLKDIDYKSLLVNKEYKATGLLGARVLKAVDSNGQTVQRKVIALYLTSLS